MIKLATLESKAVREIWKNEAKDFTPWLAKNASLLFEEIGITAETIKPEKNVGRYFVDITAEESRTQKKIIVENQLERTDHDHLGKLLTYASNRDACIIVWVVSGFTEEHRKAIEWLNEHTDDEVAFFLVKVEAFCIEDSNPAPKFNVVVEPNLKIEPPPDNDITTTKLNHQRFWEGFKEFASNSDTELNISPKPKPRAWYDIYIRYGGVCLRLDINTQDERITTGIYIANNKELYESLYLKKDLFEQIVGDTVDWRALEGKQASRILCSLDGNPHEKSNQEDYFDWMLRRSNEFAMAFKENS